MGRCGIVYDRIGTRVEPTLVNVVRSSLLMTLEEFILPWSLPYLLWHKAFNSRLKEYTPTKGGSKSRTREIKTPVESP